MIDLQALSLPAYLILLVLTAPCILAYKLIRWHLLSAPPPISPNISPNSYTPLPATLLTPPIGVPYQHHILTTPTSRIHYVTTSPPIPSTSTPLLPPLLFVHGWPDWWYVWRHQLAHFAPLSAQCVAVDMRGFGYSEVGGDKEDASKYTLVQQCSDIVAVLDELKIDRCVLVGFDWGGMVVWDMARRYPSRLQGVAVLGAPYRPRREWRLPLPVMLRLAPNWVYQIYFRYCRLQAARELESDIGRTLSLTVRSTRPSDGIGLFKSLTAATLLSTLPLHAPRSAMLTAEELRWMVEMYRWSGFRYSLLWYANHTRNSRQAMKTPAQLGLPSQPSQAAAGELRERIGVPALMMMAERDAILQPVLAEGMERWCDRLTSVMIREGGHWAQLEQTEQVNEVLKEWLSTLVMEQPKSGERATTR